MWIEINRVGPTPVDLESTGYFTLSYRLLLLLFTKCPQVSTCPQPEHIRRPPALLHKHAVGNNCITTLPYQKMSLVIELNGIKMGG